MKAGAERFALFAAVLVALAGYLAVYRPYEATIAERFAQVDADRVLLEQRSADERRARGAARDERVLAAWLHDAGLRDGRAALVDRFLHDVAAAAHRNGVRIAAVAGETMPPPGATAAAALDEIALTLSVGGTYRRVMHLVRDLMRLGPAARIEIDALAVADRGAHEPDLRATVHVTLLRVPDAPPVRDRVAG